jgi:hypothetical protein
MAKFNGTTLLLYNAGTLFAAQKNCTFSWEQDLIDATCKDSSGWAEHINGIRTSTCDFEGLFSTTGLNSVELMGYITSRTSILVVATGSGVTIVGEANLKTFSINAPKEEAAGLSGTFESMGGFYMLAGANAQLFTDFDNVDYDTFTEANTVIASAINASGSASALSDTISVSSGDRIKVFTYLTLTSGQAPTVSIWDNTSADISNAEALAAGANFKTLTVTSNDASASLKIANTGASNFSTSAVYCFKA